MGASILVHVTCSKDNQENVFAALERWTPEGIVLNELWLPTADGVKGVFAIFTADEPEIIEALAEAVPRYLQRRFYEKVDTYPWVN